jgi:hypothetical protein
LEDKRTRSVREEPKSFMTIGLEKKHVGINPSESFGLREFDEFCVFVVKEANSPKFWSLKLIWVVGSRGTHVRRSTVIRKSGYPMKSKCDHKSVQVSQSFEGRSKSWSLVLGARGDRSSVVRVRRSENLRCVAFWVENSQRPE